MTGSALGNMAMLEDYRRFREVQDRQRRAEWLKRKKLERRAAARKRKERNNRKNVASCTAPDLRSPIGSTSDSKLQVGTTFREVEVSRTTDSWHTMEEPIHGEIEIAPSRSWDGYHEDEHKEEEKQEPITTSLMCAEQSEETKDDDGSSSDSSADEVDDDDDDGRDLIRAATTIQAMWRGELGRTAADEIEEMRNRQLLQGAREFSAAILIQRISRGMLGKQRARAREKESNWEEEDEADIEIEVEIEFAAIQIQRVFRGFNSRVQLLVLAEIEAEEAALAAAETTQSPSVLPLVGLPTTPTTPTFESSFDGGFAEPELRILVFVGAVDPYSPDSDDDWLAKVREYFLPKTRNQLDNCICVFGTYQSGGSLQEGDQSYDYADQIVSQKLTDALGGDDDGGGGDSDFECIAHLDPFVSASSIRLHVFVHEAFHQRYRCAARASEPPSASRTPTSQNRLGARQQDMSQILNGGESAIALRLQISPRDGRDGMDIEFLHMNLGGGSNLSTTAEELQDRLSATAAKTGSEASAQRHVVALGQLGNPANLQPLQARRRSSKRVSTTWREAGSHFAATAAAAGQRSVVYLDSAGAKDGQMQPRDDIVLELEPYLATKDVHCAALAVEVAPRNKGKGLGSPKKTTKPKGPGPKSRACTIS